jgi:hypothetical protein
MFPVHAVTKQQNILIDHVELQTFKHDRYGGEKMIVRNFFFFKFLGFWSEAIP